VERISDLEELKALGRLAIRKELLLLTPLFIYINWCLPYIGSYMSLYFTVRARALASLVSALAQIAGTLMMGTFLDWNRFSINVRATAAYVFTMTLLGACWVWGTIVQKEYSEEAPGLDWSDSGFGRGWALYILWQVGWAMTYNYGYWIIGSLAREAADIPRLTSYVRALESAGQTVSSGISSTKTPLITALGINFGLWGIAVIPALLVVRKVGILYVGFQKKSAPAVAEEDSMMAPSAAQNRPAVIPQAAEPT